MITQQSSIHAANVRITFQLFCWERNKLISTKNHCFVVYLSAFILFNSEGMTS